MGIIENSGGGGGDGGTGALSGGRNGSRENGGICCGFIVERDGSAGIVIVSTVFHIVGFLF